MGLSLGSTQFLDPVRKLIPLWLLKVRAQRRISLRLLRLRPPLASIVDAGYPRHAEGKRIDQRQMLLVGQYAGHSGHIMIVHKGQQMLSLIKRPVLRSELPKQRMHDLEQIHAVEAAEKPFIALIVGGRMEHAVVHETIIVSVQHLSQQKELRLQALCITAQPPQEAFVQTVRHIQPQPVDVKLLHPAFHALQKIVHHLLIAEVQLHQIIVPLPALIPKAVIVVGIPVEVNPMEPIDIGGSSPVSQHIHKRPEPSAHMIEYTVQDHIHSKAVRPAYKFF